MNYNIKIDAFEGPLDLLLHLIKKSNMDIININIDEITKQYLSYINEMEELNINVASEYLVTAAELIEIKSVALLPKKDDEIEEEEEVNSKETLINKLLDYQKYKEITSSFKELENQRSNIYIKAPENRKNYTESKIENEENYTTDDLYTAFLEFIKRIEMQRPLTTKVTTKEYSIKERSKEIRAILTLKKQVIFDELFNHYDKEYLIVTFLSILEMVKNNEINIKQEHNFETIILSLKGVSTNE